MIIRNQYYEHKFMKVYDPKNIQDTLNVMSKKGWELVTVVITNELSTGFTCYNHYFKREKIYG